MTSISNLQQSLEISAAMHKVDLSTLYFSILFQRHICLLHLPRLSDIADCAMIHLPESLDLSLGVLIDTKTAQHA